MASRAVFPLRWRNERLRALTAEVASRLGISQNELIEQAIEHEVVARGGMLSEDLRAAADRLAELTQEQYERIQARGLERFVAGEGLLRAARNPIHAACRCSRSSRRRPSPPRPGRHDNLPIGTYRAGMTAPSWQEDDPKNLSLIQGNAAQLITELRTTAAERILPTREELCRWHARLYAGCEVPVSGYVGHFRGDPAVKELIDYEVGLGARLKDGNLEKMGVWARQVGEEMDGVLAGLHAVFTELDARLPVGKPATTPDDVLALISFTALAHGECLRVHPFANGNGRIARLLVAFICLRYGLPMFLHIKPRPESEDYIRASRDSMGRPPDFLGNHTTTTAVFAHLLADVLSG